MKCHRHNKCTSVLTYHSHVANAISGASDEHCFEKWSKKIRLNAFNTNLCFVINNKHLKCSNICSALASKLARFLYKMALFEGVVLMT